METRNASAASGGLPERAVEAAAVILIIVVALVGNVSLWAICIRDPKLRSHVSTWLMLCLGSADILVSMVNMPTVVVSIVAGSWLFGDGFCVAAGFICMVTFIASVMSLTSISVYRYALACHISKVKVLYTNKNTIYIIAGTWLLAVVLALPPLVGWGQYGYLPNQSICFCKWKTSVSYTYFMISTCFLGPCSVMTFCYVMILRRIRSIKARLLSAGSRGSGAGLDVSTLSYSTSDHDVTKSSQSANGKRERLDSSAEDPAVTADDDRLVASSVREKSADPIRNESFRNGGTPAPGTDAGVKSGSVHCSQIEINLSRIQNDGNERATANAPQSPNVPASSGSATVRRSPTDTLSRFQADTRLTWSFFIVVLTFVLCWLPFCITMLISVHAKDELPRIGAMLTLILGCFNSCCNPIIYGVMNTKYRPGFVALFCRRPCCAR